jgi:flavin-dependent dehydrogenase
MSQSSAPQAVPNKSEMFDTVIVGARCAGATLAIHLARAGQRVLLLDGAKLPSDQPMSSHIVSAMGVEWLDELGVGAEVRKLSPPIFGMRVDLAGTTLDVSFRGHRAAHGLRRMHFDRLLQEAAVRAGADLRDQTKVVGLVREGDRVVGVEVVHEGTQRQYRARVVVGADGRHSTVAELAGAKEYLGYDNPRFYYWAYWPDTPAWPEELRSFGSYLEFDAHSKIRMVFHTDGGLLIGVAVLQSELPSWKGRFEEAYLETLRESPVTRPLVDGNAREGKLLGL